MQIREQAHKIQCLRSQYSTESKRSRQTTIGSFSRYSTEAPQELLDLLTEAEKQELTDYMTERAAKQAAERHHSRINTAAYSIKSITEAVSSETLTETDAAGIYTAMAELAKALKKAGHAKPKRTRKPALRNNDSTADIFSDADAAGGVSDLTSQQTRAIDNAG